MLNNVVLVSPSVREEHCREFLRAWLHDSFWKVIVRWDGEGVPASLLDEFPSVTFVDRCYTRRWLRSVGDDPGEESLGIFSAGSSACRIFGYLMAASHRQVDAIMTLDDDCLPRGNPKTVVLQHLENVSLTPPWTESILGVRTRGLPYFRDVPPASFRGAPRPLLSVGLWSGVPDMDALSTLTGPPIKVPDDPGVRVMSNTQFWPMSGMNMMFRPELLPAMYIPLMGKGSRYDRFDDIWSGLFIQCVLRMLDRTATVGRPLVHHSRASDVYVNAAKEMPGYERNEHLWVLLSIAAERSSLADLSQGKSPADEVASASYSLAVSLWNLLGPAAKRPFRMDDEWVRYLRDWAAAVPVWLDYLRKAGLLTIDWKSIWEDLPR